MWHRLVETTCHASQALVFWAKKSWISFTITLRFAASLKKYCRMMSAAYKLHQTVTFSGCIGSFCNSSGWSSLQNRPQIKKVDLRPSFQDPIHQKFCVAVGCSALSLAPAVFWKALHLNSSAKFFTLLSNRGPIAADGDELIIDSHHYHWPIQLRYFLQFTL